MSDIIQFKRPAPERKYPTLTYIIGRSKMLPLLNLAREVVRVAESGRNATSVARMLLDALEKIRKENEEMDEAFARDWEKKEKESEERYRARMQSATGTNDQDTHPELS